MKWFKVRNVSISTFEAPRHEVFSVSSSWVMSDDQWTFVAKRQVIFTYRSFLKTPLLLFWPRQRSAIWTTRLSCCKAATQSLFGRRNPATPENQLRRDRSGVHWLPLHKAWISMLTYLLHISCRFLHPDWQMSRRRLEHVVRSGPVHKLSFFAPCITPKRRSRVAAHFPKQQDFPLCFLTPTLLVQNDLAWERDEEIWCKYAKCYSWISYPKDLGIGACLFDTWTLEFTWVLIHWS